MPTGYTQNVPTGISFEDFALTCAKAFGACSSMRELPSDAPIPEEFEASDYHVKALAAAREQLATYVHMHSGEADEACRVEYEAAEASRRHRLQENLNTLECYKGMRDQVLEWVAPSEDHVGLKEFMLKQLNESIEWDDSTKYLSVPTERLNVGAWLEGKKAAALKDISYHKEKNAEEQARTAQRNLWVRQLRESLK